MPHRASPGPQAKSGKTVLINKMIPADNLITVSGGTMRNAEMLWARVLNWMKTPSGTAITSGHTASLKTPGKASGKANFRVFCS
jgi:hypothetical protein